jgi:cystathionine beta-synthase
MLCRVNDDIFMSSPNIFDNVLQVIGNTPMVRFNRIGSEYPVEILAKCEFLNPGGSVKDRIGWKMVEDAEKEGRLKPGDTIIEATSGNTGIGLAMAAAVKGYRLIITMPEKMSLEKQRTMEALGAEIIRTPTEAAYDDPRSHLSVAMRMANEQPNTVMLNQYINPSNPRVHYEDTGREIVEQTGGKLDYMVIAIGTGGTLTGIGQRLREEIPNCKIVAVDPVGSIMGGGTEVGTYMVEGIGYDFLPEVFHPEYMDEVVKTEDKPSFQMARRIIREEGLLVGGSSGAAVWAALQIAKKCKGGERICVILPDSIRNYMSKFLSLEWMSENQFAEEMEAVARR